jgi:TonB family protein
MRSLVSYGIVWLWTSLSSAEIPDVLMREPVTLHCQSTPLRDVLDQLSKQIPISFVFRDLLVDDILISYDIENGMLKDVLNHLIPAHQMSYKLLDNSLVVLIPKVKTREATERCFQAPELIHKTKPVYPDAAIRLNASGVVTLYLLIDQEGCVDSVRLKSSSGFSLLDSTAMDYASTLRFSPALSDNKPVPIWMEWEFDFKFIDGQGAAKMNSEK